MKFIYRHFGSDVIREDLAIKQIRLKVLSTVIAAVALLMPATAVYAAPDSPLESLGTLTLETGDPGGAPDSFVYYPPDGAAPEVQWVNDEDKNKCELDQSSVGTGRPDLPDDVPDLLVALSLVMGTGSNVGVSGSDQQRSSFGGFRRGGGGNARGVKCGRVDGPEILVIAPGAHFDRDMDGKPDVVVANARMDWEFKGSPVLLFTAISGYDESGNPISEEFFVASGSNSAVDVPDATRLLNPDGTDQCFDLTGQDTQSDNGSADNCRITIQKVVPAEEGEEEGVVIEKVYWRTLHAQVLEQYGDGQASFEGGGDWVNQSQNVSEFDLVRVDAEIGCGEGLSTTSSSSEDGFIQTVRLNTSGEGCADQTSLLTTLDLINNGWELLFQQNTGVTVALAASITWATELVSSLDDIGSVVSWDAVEPDWLTCVAEPSAGTPRCFELQECEGTPLRFCGAVTTGTPCVMDTQCSAAGPGNESCELTELVERSGGLIDMDDDYPDPDDSTAPAIPGTEGLQHMCFVAEHLTLLGTAGLNGVIDGCTVGEEGCDDTAEDHNLIQQEIFIKGDARGGRQ